MFPDLNVITFDGNNVAIYKAASYVVAQLPNETVNVLVQECPAGSPVCRAHRELNVNPCFIIDFDLIFFFFL